MLASSAGVDGTGGIRFPAGQSDQAVFTRPQIVPSRHRAQQIRLVRVFRASVIGISGAYMPSVSPAGRTGRRNALQVASREFSPIERQSLNWKNNFSPEDSMARRPFQECQLVAFLREGRMAIRGICISMLFIIGGSGQCAGQTRGQATAEVFPMSKGTYWVYHGTLNQAFTDDDGERKEAVTSFNLKMEIVDSLRHGRYQVAKLLGYPDDYPSRRSCHFWIAVDDKEFYLAECSATEEKQTRLVLSDEEITAKIHKRDLIFRLPLKKDDSFGEDPDISYKWIVDDVRPLEMVNIPGIATNLPRMEYVLAYDAPGSHWRLFVNYIPGIGVTSCGSQTGGSGWELKHADLVEFKSRRPK